MIREASFEVLVKSVDVLSSWLILFLGLLVAILGYISWRKPQHKKASFWSMVAMVAGIVTACLSIVSHLCSSAISDWDRALLDGAMATVEDQSNRLTSARAQISVLRHRTGQRRIREGTPDVGTFILAVQSNGLVQSASWANGVRQWPDGREKRISVTFTIGDHEAAVFAWDLRFLLQLYFEVPSEITAYVGGYEGISIFVDESKPPTPEALGLVKTFQQLGYSTTLRSVPPDFIRLGDNGHKRDFVLHIGPKIGTDPVDTGYDTTEEQGQTIK